MSCRRFSTLLSPYLDGELLERDRTRVSEHCEACSACAGELERLRALSVDFQALEEQDAPLGDSWEATLAARLAMADMEIESQLPRPRARSLAQMMSMAAMLLFGLSIGLFANRVVPGGESEVADAGGSKRATPAAVREASLLGDLTRETPAEIYERGNVLAEFAEDAYAAGTDARQEEILPGSTDDLRLAFFLRELELSSLRERSQNILVAARNVPDLHLREDVVDLAHLVQDLGNTLHDTSYPARSRLQAIQDQTRTILQLSSQVGTQLHRFNSRRPGETLLAGQSELAAVATRMRLHALRREDRFFQECLARLTEQLGSSHPYVTYNRDFWSPVAELNANSSCVPIKTLLSKFQEMEQPEILFIILSTDAAVRFNAGTRNSTWQFHVELKKK